MKVYVVNYSVPEIGKEDKWFKKSFESFDEFVFYCNKKINDYVIDSATASRVSDNFKYSNYVSDYYGKDLKISTEVYGLTRKQYKIYKFFSALKYTYLMDFKGSLYICAIVNSRMVVYKDDFVVTDLLNTETHHTKYNDYAEVLSVWEKVKGDKENLQSTQLTDKDIRAIIQSGASQIEAKAGVAYLNNSIINTLYWGWHDAHVTYIINIGILKTLVEVVGKTGAKIAVKHYGETKIIVLWDDNGLMICERPLPGSYRAIEKK